MNPIDNLIERKFANLQTSTARRAARWAPDGRGRRRVTLTVRELAPLAHLAAGQVGLLAR